MPAFGGETIRPRCPRPIGATRLSSRVERMFGAVSRLISSRGKMGVNESNDGRRRAVSAIDAVDGLHAQQAEELLVVLWRPHLTADAVAGAKTEAANLRLRDVDVIRAGKESRTAQKTEAVFDDLEDAVAEDLPIFLRLRAQQTHHLFLLRQATKRRNLEVSGHLGQFLGRLGLELGDGQMGWTGSGGRRRCGIRRTVPRPRLIVSSLPAVSRLPAVATVPGIALGAVGSLARRRSRPAVTPSPTISCPIALVEVGSTVAGRFDRAFDRWCNRGWRPFGGGDLRGFRPRRVRYLNVRHRGRVHGNQRPQVHREQWLRCSIQALLLLEQASDLA